MNEAIQKRHNTLVILGVSLTLVASTLTGVQAGSPTKLAKNTNKKYIKEIRRLEKNIQDLQVSKKQADRRIKELEQETTVAPVLAKNRGVSTPQHKPTRQRKGSTTDKIQPPAVSADVVRREAKALELLSEIDAFSEQDPGLRLDSAKAHYNMGNIYFQKGEFEMASREYFQAVVLMPNDPDAHYNLAFVSGEHLKDFETALKHYRMYLYLNPLAKDVNFVQHKIMSADLALKALVNSPLESTR